MNELMFIALGIIYTIVVGVVVVVLMKELMKYNQRRSEQSE